jgi:hypothetical protein
MKKGQGAKSRSTYLEAERGPSASYAEHLVAFFIQKKGQYALKYEMLKGLEALKKPSSVQRALLPKLKEEVKSLGEEVAHILTYAPREHPRFLENLAKAEAIKNPVYPAEVRMFKAYTYFRYCEPMYRMTLEELEANGAPPPADVSYQKLFEATQDENGNPSASQFSRMVKRYPDMILTRGKPGRKAHAKG